MKQQILQAALDRVREDYLAFLEVAALEDDKIEDIEAYIRANQKLFTTMREVFRDDVYDIFPKEEISHDGKV